MKLLLTILFSVAFLSAFSQNYDYLQAYRRFTLANRAVKGISIDTTFANASVDSLATQYAVKGYIEHHSPVSNLFGLKHQQVVARLDNSNLLEFVDPLAHAGFVTTDLELTNTEAYYADQATQSNIYDLRTGQRYVADITGTYAGDTGNYFNDYGVRRWLFNPATGQTIYVYGDSTWSYIGQSAVTDTTNHDYNFNLDQFIVSGPDMRDISLVNMPAPGEPLFIASPANELTEADLSKLHMLHLDSTFLDSRDFYGDGDTVKPIRVTRFVPGGDSLINITDPAFFDIPAGSMLETVIIQPASDAAISIGTSSGSDDIAESETVTASEGETYVLNRNAFSTTRIYFTGIPTGSQVYFILKRIT